MTDLSSLTYPELLEWVKAEGLPSFRAKQIFSWLSRGVMSFDEMTDLSKDLRTKLSETCTLATLETETRRVSEDGTQKYLFRLSDGNRIETVLMRYNHGNSVCISSQVGCNMGCRFCASTLTGKTRNLTAGEMAAQVRYLAAHEGLTHVVVMGVGEPLDNYENLVRFIDLITCPEGLDLSARHLSVSTCGLVPRIRELAEKKLQLTLSVSLHAPDDETRNLIMPVNARYPLKELLSACDVYTASTGRRISYEYILIDGVNDTPAHAARLIALMKPRLSHVNLIPMNPVAERPFRRPSEERVQRFFKTLEAAGIAVTCRRKLGDDIDAACGQLRAKAEGKIKETKR